MLGDANLESFRDTALLQRRGADVVCCINASRKKPFEHPITETIDDVVEEITKPRFDHDRFTKEQWEALPETIRYRVIRCRVPAGRMRLRSSRRSWIVVRGWPADPESL